MWFFIRDNLYPAGRIRFGQGTLTATHLKPLAHEPVLQDSGITCAPQFAMGFTGTSAYFVTHLWYLNELGAVAPEFFRARLDVEPKLRFASQMGLMVMANMALAGPRLPMAIPQKFLGDFNKWYLVYRQIPTLARIITTRGKVIKKAERILKTRFSDALDAE